MSTGTHIHGARIVAAWILFLVAAASCVAADGDAAGSFGSRLPRLTFETEGWEERLDGSMPLQFSASGWNLLADLEGVGVPTASAGQPWRRGAFSELVRDFESQGLLDSAVYRRSLDDAEFVCLDLRNEDQSLRLARLRGAIEEGTTISAEWLRQKNSHPLLGLPSEAAKLNIETRLGGFKLYGEFTSSNWNGLFDGVSGPVLPSVGTAALQPPGETNSLSPLARGTGGGESTAFELGARIPLNAAGESRLSFRRGSETVGSNQDLAEELGIEGALRLQEGVKLRAGFAKRTSFPGGRGDGVTEDSIWTGIDIQF